MTGSNDAAIITGAVTGDVVEDAAVDILSTSGTLTISDVDSGNEEEFVTQIDTVGSYGAFNVDSLGAWTYSADTTQINIQILGVGDTLQDTFVVESVDGTTQSVTMTITGTNDAPDVSSVVGGLLEDSSTVLVDVAGSFSDVDVSDSHTVTVDVASTGWLATVSGTIITFTPPVGAYDYLADGDISAETFTYTVDDGNGGVTSNTVTITVTGSNDGPTLSSVISDQSTAEDALYSYDCLWSLCGC